MIAWMLRESVLLVGSLSGGGDGSASSVASVTPSIAPGDRTTILILATCHLDSVAGFEPPLLDELVDSLEDFAPDAICVEALPGRELEWMQAGNEAYAQVVSQFGAGLEWSNKARERLALSRAKAEEWLKARDLAWDPLRTPQDPAALRQRIDHCLAAGDVPSAVLQRAYLEDAGGDAEDLDRDRASRFLEEHLHSNNEVYSLALPLERRLGLARLEAVDDHLDKDDYLRIAPTLASELAQSEVMQAPTPPIYAKTAEITRSAVESGNLLPLYRFLNSESYAREDVLAQWDLFLRTHLKSQLDRTRLALWDVRNYGIAANIRRVTAGHPGGRILVILGAAHRPFLEAILHPMLDLRVVSLEEVLGGTPPAEGAETSGASAAAREDAALTDEWYLNASDGQCRLLVREYGHGTDSPVVVLHGGWGAEYSYLLDALAPHFRSHRFVCYDQRGSLRSPAPAESISVAQHVQDLDELRQALGLERIRVLAHSMGTFLAMAYLDRYPSHVSEVVLAAAVPPRADRESPIQPTREQIEVVTDRPAVHEELAKAGLLDPKTDRDRTHSWRIQFAAVNLYHVERWRELRGGKVYYSTAAADAAARSMPEQWDFTPALRGHPYPITILEGDSDYVDLGVQRWRAVAAEIPDLDLQVLEYAGHVAWIDQPEGE